MSSSVSPGLSKPGVSACSFLFSPWSCVCAKGWSAAMWNSLSDPMLTTTASGCSAPEPWLLPGCSSVYDSLVRYEILLQRGGVSVAWQRRRPLQAVVSPDAFLFFAVTSLRSRLLVAPAACEDKSESSAANHAGIWLL